MTGTMSRLSVLPLAVRKAILAALLIVLGANALIPMGYMLAPSEDGAVTVSLCPDTNPIARLAPTGSVDHAAMGHADLHPDGDGHSSGKSTTDCAYSGLAKAATVADDPFILGIALAFALLIGLAPTRQLKLRSTPRLRPPLRGPPLPT